MSLSAYIVAELSIRVILEGIFISAFIQISSLRTCPADYLQYDRSFVSYQLQCRRSFISRAGVHHCTIIPRSRSLRPPIFAIIRHTDCAGKSPLFTSLVIIPEYYTNTNQYMKKVEP